MKHLNQKKGVQLELNFDSEKKQDLESYLSSLTNDSLPVNTFLYINNYYNALDDGTYNALDSQSNDLTNKLNSLIKTKNDWVAIRKEISPYVGVAAMMLPPILQTISEFGIDVDPSTSTFGDLIGDFDMRDYVHEGVQDSSRTSFHFHPATWMKDLPAYAGKGIGIVSRLGIAGLAYLSVTSSLKLVDFVLNKSIKKNQSKRDVVQKKQNAVANEAISIAKKQLWQDYFTLVKSPVIKTMEREGKSFLDSSAKEQFKTIDLPDRSSELPTAATYLYVCKESSLISEYSSEDKKHNSYTSLLSEIEHSPYDKNHKERLARVVKQYL